MAATLVEFKDWLENGINYMGSGRNNEIHLRILFSFTVVVT
jgi:hypothetical protein